MLYQLHFHEKDPDRNVKTLEANLAEGIGAADNKNTREPIIGAA